MRHEFDKDYWDRHWADDPGGAASLSPHPYLARETTGLVPSTALDAGAGTGSEAIWLAAHGWHVTAVDISAKALARARERTANTPMTGRVRWIEADLTSWEPGRRFGLVTSSYAHPAMPRQAFYRRIAAWVAPGGTLLIVGHLHAHAHADHRPPAEASAAPDDITGSLDSTGWRVETEAEHTRELAGPGGRAVLLRDVVVRATRLH